MLSAKIKEIRKRNNLTQVEFAKSLTVGQPYISSLEKGKEAPSKMFIKLLCLIYSIDESYLQE